jgi:DNA-binding protein HU-beta
MRENMTSGDVIDRLAHNAGIRKKLAAGVLHVIPEIIEGALKSEGEVRVKGLGTFRMKWTQPRVGRNPKTGERVAIPAHNRLVFLPEQSFKEFVNRDNRLLSYKVIPVPEAANEKESLIREPEFVSPPVSVPDLQPPARKRRIHWIIPAAIAVIAVLCVVFYFRNFYPEYRIQKSEVRSQKTEDGRQKTEDRSQKSEDRSQQPVLKAEPEGSAVGGQQPVDSIQNSELTSVPEGRHLFRLAREVYGNPFLWVLIYRANLDNFRDPDMVISGKEIVIPELEGKPDKLSRNDSLAVSDGYRLVYEFYKEKGDPRAEDFHRGAEKYSPK